MDSSSIGLIKDSEHHWVFVSNVYEPLIVFGRYHDFVAQLTRLQPLSDGNCDEIFAISGLVAKPFEVFASKYCVYSPEENQSLLAKVSPELKDDKTEKWVWPLGFVLGAGFLYGMRDKKIVFKLPGLHW